ncbi:aspartate carbamoyltransferase regulatory subunit [Haloferax mediterranei ATCC 33500]|uniref:Aspartate carbamoyltransferase regulatory chain n=1 Tax=Haloferax mediterranei (strain ATCC 33500 / DSM 1411 / JCM 8866 / NBRC 14739 / NCIMB 2177 / R-4) TaxID=523841 RepID=I3R4R7_HALMT|nr:aspartate carbamoyltransferase regulatory subunit [Haloferax mediterranei]AFK19227.1 aspartate carbamoyltransferase regulatory subunit [Haloferax mediterranei ATCC 33500]AHZ21411.1 aspartate carbamoyltransferase [Haloferax mediterranei ATCC 33500]EMA03870.1 aspartate carbamoyltransferase regulatory subunit [Haloferax mediterranei ATCC 33500]MDX5989328.1 aspartate carbamoyltransferase regulatory subunit [Haloferax mediterranei ATCC 33500]QCQ75694.1 aspartate carbamoyltransferase regulatory s
MTDDHQLRVSKIQNGTVIDHVAAGQALNVLAILGIDGTSGEAVSVGMNVPSDRLGRKDIVKVEGRELSQSEVDVISLIAPAASINIVRDYDVIEKNRVVRPDVVTGIISCPNRNCITNADEPITSRFTVLSDGVRCDYCESIVREDEVAANLDVN